MRHKQTSVKPTKAKGRKSPKDQTVDEKDRNGEALRSLLQEAGLDFSGLEDSDRLFKTVADALIRGRGGADYLGPPREGPEILRESEERLRILVGAAFEGIIVTVGGTILEANQAFADMFGYSLDDVIGRSRSDLTTAESAEQIARHNATGDESVLAIVGLKRDGTQIELEVVGKKCSYKGRVARIVAVRDITESNRVDSALKRSEELYRTLVETANDSILTVLPPEGRITDVNTATVAMLGYSVKELKALNGSDIIAPEVYQETVREWSTQVGEKGSFIVESRWVRKDGSRIDVEVSGRPVEIHGRFFFQLITRDITERKRAESELRQAQRLSSVGALANGIAHEINNPINGIMNYAQLISDRLGNEDPCVEFAKEIIHETERVATLARNLLEFSGRDAGQNRLADMADMIHNTLSLIRTALLREQITLEVDVPPLLPPVLCRRQQIQQVLMSLFDNARDALNTRYEEYDSNKVLLVTARQITSGGVRILRVTVEDRGMGIPEEELGKIFDPFFTTKNRAIRSGIGLAVSQRVALDHQGFLRCESEVGEYTKFVLDIPSVDGTA